MKVRSLRPFAEGILQHPRMNFTLPALIWNSAMDLLQFLVRFPDYKVNSSLSPRSSPRTNGRISFVGYSRHIQATARKGADAHVTYTYSRHRESIQILYGNRKRSTERVIGSSW